MHKHVQAIHLLTKSLEGDIKMVNMVTIYLDGAWHNVTPYLQSNDVVRQSRCDDAFAAGSLQLRYDRSTNIPPYTLLCINGDEFWFAKSTCRRYLTKPNYYIHNVELLELTSILSCYILGSKNFSVAGTNRKDYEKLEVIAKLMRQKYGITFTYDSDAVYLDKQQEFTFGPGTTYYDALLEIAKSYDGVKVKVSGYNPVTKEITIKFTLDNSIYHLQEQRILDEYYVQDSETYGAILESEMANVIDRTNTTKISDITSRTDDFRMDLQNCCIMLPTRCENIVDFGISSDVGKLFCKISLSHKYTNCIWNNLPNIDSAHPKPYREWLSFVRDENRFSPLDTFLDLVKEHYGIEKESILDTIWYQVAMEDVSDHVNKYFILLPYNDGNTIDGLPSRFSLKDNILPKNKWLLLEDAEKPKYAYYESGSNKIEGMDSYYKNDFWNNIIGNTVKPFLDNIDYSDNVSENLNDSKDGETRTTIIECSYQLNFSEAESKSLLYSYWVEYTPIIDLFINSTKTILPNNEASIKKFSRSFDKTSNYIDFDRLADSIQLTNDMMGLPEGTIEYKLTTDEIAPKAFQKIVRNGKEWTISSVVLTSSLKKEVSTINLVSNYNKVADAIGVKTQYNETKNPLENIIDRPIFWEVDGSSILGVCNECWAELTIASKKLFKRCVVVEKNKVVYVYFEAIDQYCFDRQAVSVNDLNKTDCYYCNDISYCDENNEVIGARISIGVFQKLTREESLDMPLYSGSNFKEILDLGTKLIYKDARERLIFTLKINNCKIVPKSVFYNEE